MSNTFDRSQLPSITELGDLLRAAPTAWRDIPDDYRKALEYDLMPYTVSDPAKVAWVRKWFLKATQEQIDAINNLLPGYVRVQGCPLVDSDFALSCDLLSDSKPGQTYAAAREILESLVLIYEPELKPQTYQTIP